MKSAKLFLGILLCILLFVLIRAASDGLGEHDAHAPTSAQPDKQTAKTYALVLKSSGNPYNERQADGFQEVIEQAGGICLINYPDNPTAEAQIVIINQLINKGVDSIAVAANDFEALNEVLQSAMAQGIKVSTLDSDVNPKSRMVFVNQAGVHEVAETLLEAVYELADGRGQWAILSATSQAANQNAWIEEMKSIMQNDKYLNLDLVDIVFGDDEYPESAAKTEELLNDYKDLNVICAPTAVGISAAANVLKEHSASGRIKLTGLGLPSEMADNIGLNQCCPFMFLWNPIDIGKLSAYTSLALVNETITGTPGETFTAGKMGSYTIVETKASASRENGSEIIAGPPFRFDSNNIDYWKTIY